MAVERNRAHVPMVAESSNEGAGGRDPAADGVRRSDRAPHQRPGVERPYHANAARPTVDPRAASAYADAIQEHEPERPSWACQACAEPWPCVIARARLLGIPRFQLGLIMNVRLAEAASDLPNATPGALWERFVSWTHRPPGQ